MLADSKLASLWIGAMSLCACVVVACTLHEPVPRVHDEFSYELMAETFAKARVSNPATPLPEFFDTFHVLVRPVYASKYFPGQGVLLALGQILTGHAAAGVWLSSALACAAITWMLQSWVGTGWGLLGGFLALLQYGALSYWSQAYWGGMVAALGGALFFGAIRRLWDRLTWQNALWAGIGLVTLASSRPLEGIVAVLPVAVVFLYHVCRNQRWREEGLWLQLAFPCGAVLLCGAAALGAYNHSITGSALKTPYALHEQQYQESPPFIFLSLRPKHTYSSPMLQYYYEVNEMRPYVTQRIPKYLLTGIVRKLSVWWAFYCGYLLSIPLVLPGLLRRGWIRWTQLALLLGFIGLSILSGPATVAVRVSIDLLAVAQIVVLWSVFDDLWSRLAIVTCSLLLLELFLTKWFFSHYFAPAACLVLYLEVEGLRRTWSWNPQAQKANQPLTRAERRRLNREKNAQRASAPPLRWVVYFLPIACLISLIVRVEARLNGWPADRLGGPDRQALLMDDWSLDRANMEKHLELEEKPQLVFVRYSPYHNINFEWVYNHADIMHSHVIWARDLGADHNKLLLNLLPDRTVWLLEADRRNPQLVPYAQAESMTPSQSPEDSLRGGSTVEDEQTN